MIVDDRDERRAPARRGSTGMRATRTALGRSLLTLLFLLLTIDVRAHTVGQSYLYLQVYENRVTGRFEVSLADFNAALRLSGTDREITAANLDQKIDVLKAYYLSHVTISDARGPLSINFTTHGLFAERGGFALLSFDIGGLDRVPDRLTFDYSVLFDEEPRHRGFLLIEHNWATGSFANEGRISLVFSPDDRRKDFELTTGGRLRGFLAIVRLGADHIWMGFDHVMFLVALLLPAVLVRKHGRWRESADFMPALVNVVKIVTAFTVAHSVTLSLSALGIVQLPERLVEVVIAASIAFAAADILFPVFRGRIWLVVFGFGLFHGFGFAGALAEMGVLREHIWLSLFAFNLGVEIGQVVIVALLFPLLFALRRLPIYRQLALPVAAAAMILVSMGWVVERAFDVRLPRPGTVLSSIRGPAS
jgi:multisubunit Na+/H+ antiporter MnhG subunit